MESKNFDALTRNLGQETTRRRALLGLAGGALGLGFARNAVAQEAGGVDAAKCKAKGNVCFKSKDCCDGLECKGADKNDDKKGKCKFRNNSGGQGDFCKKNNDCKNNLVCNRKKNECEKDK